MAMPHFVVLFDERNQWKRRDELHYRYLASIWTIRLFNRCCDICKDFRLEIPAIHSRNMQFSPKNWDG